jgi:hypothetical protein
VDASPVGLGAILTQRNPDTDEIAIISYGSRALTPVEQRYSQIEREALAVVYGCERFHLYVYGNPFTVITDHQPLITMFTPHSTTPARIERWILRLQQYQMELIFKPGCNNPADFSSRHPRNTGLPSRSVQMAEEYINFIVRNHAPPTMDVKLIAAETEKDDTLQQVISAIQNHRPKTEYPPTFSNLTNELSISSDPVVVLRGNRIVLPESLCQQAIDLAHEGHMGLVKTKQLL